MKHYFSSLLVGYYWYNDEEANLIKSSVRRAGDALNFTKVDPEIRSRFGLKCQNYFSMPQLMAFDFYRAMREEFYDQRGTKMRAIRRVCAKICKLPDGGWDFSEFRATVFRAYRSRDLIVVHGTAFDTSCVAPADEYRTMIYNYEATQLLDKIQKIRRRREVYIQKIMDACYWNIHNYWVRRGYGKWRKKTNEVNKKTFRPL